MAMLPNKTHHLPLSLSGLVFLATPHRGSLEAEWSDFLVAMANVVANVRPEIVDVLKPFNPNSLSHIQAFFRLQPVPPFLCFAEGEKTKVPKIGERYVSLLAVSSRFSISVLIAADRAKGLCYSWRRTGSG